MSQTKTYLCEGCDASFVGTAEEAFDAGWDTPERFLYGTMCPDCPINNSIWWSTMVVAGHLRENNK